MSTTDEPVAPRRQPEQARSRERVAQVLAAAADLIAEGGVDAMTMSALAERAEVSLPSIYRYFPNKRAIIAALAEQHAAQVRERLEAHLGPNAVATDPRRAIVEATAAYWALYRDDPTLSAVWAAVVADPELSQLDVDDSRRNGERIAAALTSAAATPTARDATAAFLAAHLAGATARLAVGLPAEEAEAVITLLAERVVPALVLPTPPTS